MFQSSFREVGAVPLPEFSSTRVMMMPLVIGDLDSVPDSLNHYRPALSSLFNMTDDEHHGRVGYITIDEKAVAAGGTHRRGGLHVDGSYRGGPGIWSAPKGPWGSLDHGMITVSSHVGCRAWNQDFDGQPGDEGECDHLADQCRDDRETVFQRGIAYWVGGMCVHESMPMTAATNRQFVRLSMPSDAPWFDGYSVNPLGVMPTGRILPRRHFMDA